MSVAYGHHTKTKRMIKWSTPSFLPSLKDTEYVELLLIYIGENYKTD